MKLLKILREALWPQRTICLCCGRPSRGRHLCAACERALEAGRIRGPVCPVCGHALGKKGCDFCGGRGNMTMRAAWVYGDTARELVHVLKFDGVAAAAQVMADGMADVAKGLRLPPETVVTWPSMPARRKLERGIDHGALLAEALGARLSLPVKELLTRSDELALQTQVEMSGQERRRRLMGAFACGEKLNGPVLLVDDVLTTSGTAAACAQCLLAAGATRVTVVTATQTPRREKKKGSA